MKKVLVIGSTVADIIINVDYLPTTAQDIHIKSQTMALGGCAYNVSDMIRHFNIPYTLFSPVGTGLYGDFVRNQLVAKGLASPMPTPDQNNGCCYCFVEESGERTFIVEHGAEYLFYKEWFDHLKIEKISGVYICGLEIEDKTGDTIVEFLEAHPKLPVYFGPGPRLNRIDGELMSRIFALHPMVHLNEDEICRYTQCDSIENAAKALYRKTENTVIVTNGANGAFFFDGEDFIHVPPVPAVKVVDTIGAGDAHMGAVIACLEKGMSLYDSIAKANAASSLIVARKGGTISDEDFVQEGLLDFE